MGMATDGAMDVAEELFGVRGGGGMGCDNNNDSQKRQGQASLAKMAILSILPVWLIRASFGCPIVPAFVPTWAGYLPPPLPPGGWGVRGEGWGGSQNPLPPPRGGEVIDRRGRGEMALDDCPNLLEPA